MPVERRGELNQTENPRSAILVSAAGAPVASYAAQGVLDPRAASVAQWEATGHRHVRLCALHTIGHYPASIERHLWIATRFYLAVGFVRIAQPATEIDCQAREFWRLRPILGVNRRLSLLAPT